MNTFLDKTASGSSCWASGWRAWQLLVDYAKANPRYEVQSRRKLNIIQGAIKKIMESEQAGIYNDYSPNWTIDPKLDLVDGVWRKEADGLDRENIGSVAMRALRADVVLQKERIYTLEELQEVGDEYQNARAIAKTQTYYDPFINLETIIKDAEKLAVSWA